LGVIDYDVFLADGPLTDLRHKLALFAHPAVLIGRGCLRLVHSWSRIDMTASDS
jgi:hypothetical protein